VLRLSFFSGDGKNRFSSTKRRKKSKDFFCEKSVEISKEEKRKVNRDCLLQLKMQFCIKPVTLIEPQNLIKKQRKNQK